MLLFLLHLRTNNLSYKFNNNQSVMLTLKTYAKPRSVLKVEKSKIQARRGPTPKRRAISMTAASKVKGDHKRANISDYHE